MPTHVRKKILKSALIALFSLLFVASCATVDKFLDTFVGPDGGAMQEPQPARRVPLPPMIQDFEPRGPDS